VAAWGNHGFFLNRSVEVREIVKGMKCLGLNKSGEPKHPLYINREERLRDLDRN